MNPTTPESRDCAAFEEQLALELYDELEAEELAALHQHLSQCLRCTRSREQLRAGLGLLKQCADDQRESVNAESATMDVADGPTSHDPPTLAKRRAKRHLTLVASAMLASFAAGMWMMAQLRPLAEPPRASLGPRSIVDVSTAHDVSPVDLEHTEPPPPATTSGELSRFSALFAPNAR